MNDEEYEFHKSNDMALVTFLKMSGHSTQKTEFEGQTCYWFFRLSDDLVDKLDEFTSGEALVEPREYNRQFAHTKSEFWRSKEESHR